MKPPSRVVPVYPTFAGLGRLSPSRSTAAQQEPIPESEPVVRRGRLSTQWQTWFPFSARHGRWAFSGRVALYHGLPALKLPPGSTILVPNYHQGVEIDTLLTAGYRLRYYRVDQSLGIDLRDAGQRLDDTVSALYVIHYFGFAQPMAAVREFCRSHRLKLIEDCALSLFSRQDDVWLGSDGDLALFSVYKTLPLPHGGFVVTKVEPPTSALRSPPFGSTLVQTEDLIRQALRAGGWAAADRWASSLAAGVSRLIHWDRTRTFTSGGASWDPRLLGKAASRWVTGLMRLIDRDRVVARRRRNFERLAARLRGHVPCPFPELPAETCPLFFPIMVPDKGRFQQDLAGLGVESVNLWDASHPTCPPDLAAEVAHWRRHCLELPIHQELNEEAIDRVATAVLRVLETQRSRSAEVPSAP